MGINPAMGMGFGGDDFYTAMLYQQMMNGGANWANAANGTTNGANGANGNLTQPQKQGIGLMGGAAVTGAAAGAGYLGMSYLNHQFNSPVTEVKGKVQFTDDFMKRFSGEYAAIKNESAMKQFFKDLSTEVGADRAKFTVNEKNFDTIMDELKMFIEDPSNPKVADMSDDLKGFLKQRIGKTVPGAGVTIDDTNRYLYELVDDDLGAIRGHYADILKRQNELEFKNNYNLQKSVYGSFDDIVKGMDDCTDAVSKLDYLRSNPHIANFSDIEWRELFKQPLSRADFEAKIAACGGNPLEETKIRENYVKFEDIDDLFSKVKSEAPNVKNGVKGSLSSLENQMQSFAKKWDGKVGFFGKGKFNVFDKKTGGALDNALSAMRRAKGGKFAAIAAGAAAIGCLLYNA